MSVGAMSCITSILSLPEVIVCDVFSGWLEITDLSALDCAMCGSLVRSNFLSLLGTLCAAGSRQWYCISKNKSIMEDLFMKWVVARGISLSEVCWTPALLATESIKKAYLVRKGEHVRSIIFDYDPLNWDISVRIDQSKAVEDLCTHCLNVEKLLLRKKLHTATLNLMSSAWTRLIHIEINQCCDEKLLIIGAKCRALMSLTLTNTRIFSSVWIKFLETCSQCLERIGCNEPFSEEVCDVLAKRLPRIRSFPLQTAAMRDATFMKLIHDFKYLDDVEFKRSFLISPASYTILVEDRNLIQLSFCQLPNLKDVTIAAVLARAPLLEVLQIEHTGVTECSLQSIGNYCRQLKNLQFIMLNSRCINDMYIKAVALGCEKLRNVEFSNIPNSAVNTLVKHCSLLTHIYLSHCPIEDSALLAIAKNCRQLKYMSLSVCGSADLTDEGIMEIAAHCKKLKYMRLVLVKGVSQRAISQFANYSSSIRHIEIDPYMERSIKIDPQQNVRIMREL